MVETERNHLLLEARPTMLAVAVAVYQIKAAHLKLRLAVEQAV
jgi:hypothetical protein